MEEVKKVCVDCKNLEGGKTTGDDRQTSLKECACFGDDTTRDPQTVKVRQSVANQGCSAPHEGLARVPGLGRGGDACRF